ncbi:MAG: ATP-binding protein [Candidatus Micrarchaeales archaeon]
MAQDAAISKFLLDVIPIAASAVSEDEIVNNFTKAVSSSFGIENVALNDLKKNSDPGNALHGYIMNTKKTYVDNQLSEYSAFPELINYKNRGFRSCAIMPLIADGKVVSLLEMLSNDENKFNDELVRSVAFGASFIGFVLMYKGELNRSLRLATYFDAAFNNPYPQLIVSEDGTIVKTNKSAIKNFDVGSQEKRKIDQIMKIDFQKLLSLTNGTYTNIMAGSGAGKGRVFQIVAGKINDRLLHIAANDITDAFIYSTINEMITKNNEVGIVITDSNFTITNMSSNAERIFGYPKSVLATGNFIDIVSKVERDTFQRKFKESMKKDSDIVIGSVTFELGDKGKRYMHYTARKFIDGYIFILIKADLEKYIESMQKDLEDFVDASSDVVLGVDNLGYVRDCNMPAEMLTGFKKDEIIGKDVKLLYVEQEILDRDINYVRNGGKVDNSFVNIIAKDSSKIPATHSIRLLHASSQEKGIEYLIVIKELRTKTLLDDQEHEIDVLTNQSERLKREGDLKAQFIYNISHELKTPLTNIKGYSKLLYDDESLRLSAEQRDYIKTTLDEADRLMLIIQQILDAAKLEAEKVKLELKEVDLQNMGNNPSIKALGDSAINKGLEFKWEVAWDVPKIMADPNRLIQIFVNLIGNAIKFTDKGSISVSIIRKNKNNVQCNIIDTGIGINEDDKKKLFRRKFYEATKKGLVQQPGAGTGLGLSITKELVKLHGGSIAFESSVGKGSTFYFTLPVAPRQKRKNKNNSINNAQPSQ